MGFYDSAKTLKKKNFG